MTLTEKILARSGGKASVKAGDNVWVKADVLMTHDVCGPGTIGVFKREFGKTAKVWDKNRVVIIPDHYIFTADSKSNRNVDILRDFSREQGIEYFYDVIDDANGHWVAVERHAELGAVVPQAAAPVIPERLRRQWQREDAARELVRGRERIGMISSQFGGVQFTRPPALIATSIR
jgi:homoaconitase/3-isopropylmalate dehydratase large subunit